MRQASSGAPPSTAPPCAPPDFAPRQPRLVVPAGACDCHAHVLGPAQDYPFAAQRIYTPPDCVAGAYRHMLAATGVARAVLVQASVYGDDNRLLVDTLRSDPERLRGIAVGDWPHVMLRGTMPNDAELVDLLAHWLPDIAQRQQVLVDNPQALYGFGS